MFVAKNDRIRIRIVYWWNAETTIIHQDLWLEKLIPCSHQRSELSNTILCIFSRWDQRIGMGIPIPDSLIPDNFITSVLAMGVWNALECWFLPHLVLGIRSSVGILTLPLRPLYSDISLLSVLLFLRDSLTLMHLKLIHCATKILLMISEHRSKPNKQQIVH